MDDKKDTGQQERPTTEVQLPDSADDQNFETQFEVLDKISELNVFMAECEQQDINLLGQETSLDSQINQLQQKLDCQELEAGQNSVPDVKSSLKQAKEKLAEVCKQRQALQAKINSAKQLIAAVDACCSKTEIPESLKAKYNCLVGKTIQQESAPAEVYLDFSKDQDEENEEQTPVDGTAVPQQVMAAEAGRTQELSEEKIQQILDDIDQKDQEDSDTSQHNYKLPSGEVISPGPDSAGAKAQTVLRGYGLMSSEHQKLVQDLTRKVYVAFNGLADSADSKEKQDKELLFDLSFLQELEKEIQSKFLEIEQAGDLAYQEYDDNDKAKQSLIAQLKKLQAQKQTQSDEFKQLIQQYNALDKKFSAEEKKALKKGFDSYAAVYMNFEALLAEIQKRLEKIKLKLTQSIEEQYAELEKLRQELETKRAAKVPATCLLYYIKLIRRLNEAKNQLLKEVENLRPLVEKNQELQAKLDQYEKELIPAYDKVCADLNEKLQQAQGATDQQAAQEFTHKKEQLDIQEEQLKLKADYQALRDTSLRDQHARLLAGQSELQSGQDALQQAQSQLQAGQKELKQAQEQLAQRQAAVSQKELPLWIFKVMPALLIIALGLAVMLVLF